MSELRTLILGACLTLGATAAPLGAQHGRAPFDSARRELARLDSLYADRRVEYTRAESAFAAGRRSELVEHGALRIRVAASLVERVREAASIAMPSLESRGGDALRSRIARHLPSLTLVEDERLLGTERYVRILADTGRYRVPPRRFASAGHVSAEAIAEQLTALVEAYAMDDADSILVGWMMAGQLPLREPPTSAWAQAYIELMTVESMALRRCRTGDHEACLAALGVLPDEASRLDAWYAPEDHRSLAHLVTYDAKDTATSAVAHACRVRRDGAACTALMAKLSPQRVPAPLSHDVRHLFLTEVLRTGGAGAYARLMTARGPMRERLQAAAGMPLERVADGWRIRIMEARPRESSVSPLLAIATLGWCGLLTLAAFARRPTCG